MRLPYLATLLLTSLSGIFAASSIPETYGPIGYPGISPRVTAAGVETPNFHFDPLLVPKPRAWESQWIWLPKGNAPVVCFRKEILFESPPKRVQAWVSAHNSYRLFVNGRLVSRGPDDIGHDGATKSSNWTHQWLADSRDLTPYFQAGKNVVAAEVFSKHAPFSDRGIPARDGFFFQAEAEFSEKPPIPILSDATWQAVASTAFSEGKWVPLPVDGKTGKEITTLRYDAAKELPGWRESASGGLGWEAGTPIPSDHGSMRVSEIPPRMEAVWPASAIVQASEGAEMAPQQFEAKGPIVLQKDGLFTVQFDRVLSAFYSLRCKGGAGATITIMPRERMEPGGRRSSSITLKGGSLAFESPMYDSFSLLNIEVRNVTEPLEIEDIRAIFVSQPLAYRGAFACSDETLTRLWEALRRNVQVSLQTHHLDSPDHQEPLCDAGDYLVESLANWQAFHAPALARQDLRKTAWLMDGCGYQMFHTSYQLLWLQMLVEYYQHTGDGDLVRELAPYVHKLLDQFASYRGPNGLLSNAPDYMFMDFKEIGGTVCHHPPAVIGQGYLTAFFCRALQDGQRVAQLAGEPSRVERYRRLHSEVIAAFERELWNPEKGLYRDGKPFQSTTKPHRWLPEDTEIETFSPHVNLLAVLYEIAPPERRLGICNTLTAASPKLNVTPYFLYFVLPALDSAGLFAEVGVPHMRDTFIHPESSTVPELGRSGDLSHGWVASPLVAMSQRILGITPAEPGYARAEIRPQLCGLSWARGTVPLPHDKALKVDWKQNNRQFQLEVDSPVPSKIILPFKAEEISRLTANDRPIEIKSEPVRIDLEAGKFVLIVERK